MASSSSSSSTPPHQHNELGNAFDQIAPPLTSSTFTDLPVDVFINHRGIDVKHTLATAIYNTLNAMGLRVFLDKEELEAGDVIPIQLQHAMQSASLHIAIFSPNYAHSRWCLAELSFMLKTGTRIIPVFYHVNPSDLRRASQGKGIYTSAFSQHEEKASYTSEKLEEWKRALEDVSFHSGYTLDNIDDEGGVLKSIVNSVLKAMKKVPLQEVAKHPVGLDDAVRDFESTVESARREQNVQIVGIVGMGGSGKTTLAKQLYNKNRPSFYSSSFLFDVRDAAARHNLLGMQKKLVKDLDGKDLQFDNIEEGKGILVSRLRCLQVLIVLDDVDHEDQLDGLLPANNSLGSGSLIIVTSRDIGVLTKWGISCIFKMRNMNRSHAKQLFCWHAFLKSHPVHEFEDLVEKFLNPCSGLPLSLKVFGGLVYGKPLSYWESQLHKISRILPEDIRGRLKISYDALDDEEKEMFMDVACFFIGERSSLAIEFWDGCSLFLHCRKLSSLPSDFGALTNLRHIDLSGCWNLQMLPASFKQLIHLHHLDLSDCFKLTLRLDMMENMTKLEQLIFYGCRKLEELPYQITNQASLRVLDVDDTSLMYVPTNIGELRKLEVLKIGSPFLASLPSSLQNMSSLTCLKIIACEKMESLPDSLGCLNMLEVLEIWDSGVKSLANVFGQVSDLGVGSCSSLCKLKRVEISRTQVQSISISEGCCSSLVTLKLYENDHLTYIKTLPTSVKTINVKKCKMLKKIGGISGLVNLQNLTIREFPELEELPSFADVSSIQNIRIEGCDKVASFRRWQQRPVGSLEVYKVLERARD